MVVERTQSGEKQTLAFESRLEEVSNPGLVFSSAMGVGVFASPYPFLIEWKILSVRFFAGDAG